MRNFIFLITSFSFLFQLSAREGSNSQTQHTQASSSWTDPDLIPQKTKIKVIHMNEIRHAFNQIETNCGLQLTSWKEVAINTRTKIKKEHVLEIRNAINQFLERQGKQKIVFKKKLDSTERVKVSAEIMSELRINVKALNCPINTTVTTQPINIQPITTQPPIVNPGACGSSHLQTFSSPPSSGLCNSGSASSVSWTTNGNHGVFNWTCSNGGSNDYCRAFSPDCPSSVTWKVGQYSCSASNGGAATNYFSVNNPYPGNKGSATYSCSIQGSWTGPTSSTCEQSLPPSCRLPTSFAWGSCQADTNAQNTEYPDNSTYSISDTISGNWPGPGTGSSTWKCNNGQWVVISSTCSP